MQCFGFRCSFGLPFGLPFRPPCTGIPNCQAYHTLSSYRVPRPRPLDRRRRGRLARRGARCERRGGDAHRGAAGNYGGRRPPRRRVYSLSSPRHGNNPRPLFRYLVIFYSCALPLPPKDSESGTRHDPRSYYHIVFCIIVFLFLISCVLLIVCS